MTSGAASVSQKFPGMTINGVTHHEKEPAGKALLEACKGITDKADKPIGEYMGFKLSVSLDSFYKQVKLQLRGSMTYQTDLGTDTFGNITRINNALDELPKRLENIQSQLENLYKQQEAAKNELAMPFSQESELAEKEARLALLNADLNIDGDGGFDVINDTESHDDSRDDTDDEPMHSTEQSVSRFAEHTERTGTYGKSKPSILDDLRTYSAKPNPSVGSEAKSNSIDL